MFLFLHPVRRASFPWLVLFEQSLAGRRLHLGRGNQRIRASSTGSRQAPPMDPEQGRRRGEGPGPVSVQRRGASRCCARMRMRLLAGLLTSLRPRGSLATDGGETLLARRGNKLCDPPLVSCVPASPTRLPAPPLGSRPRRSAPVHFQAHANSHWSPPRGPRSQSSAFGRAHLCCRFSHGAIDGRDPPLAENGRRRRAAEAVRRACARHG